MRGRGDGVRGSAGRAGPGHGRLGVAHTEVTGFTCRGAGRSPSGVPCLPRQRIKGFESRSEQDDSYICGSICGAERESMDTAAWGRRTMAPGVGGVHSIAMLNIATWRGGAPPPFDPPEARASAEFAGGGL